MTKYQGRIELKEQKVTKANMQYFKFTINGKFWNCFDPIVNQDFHVGDYVEFETEKKGDFENLIPETMKRISETIIKTQEIIDSVKLIPADPQKNVEGIHKHINENPDSLEIGTPGKLGAIKCYHTFSDPEGFIEKIKNAKKVRDEANKLLMSE